MYRHFKSDVNVNSCKLLLPSHLPKPLPYGGRDLLRRNPRRKDMELNGKSRRRRNGPSIGGLT